MNKDDKLDPIMVLNPRTKRMINIAPLFDHINHNYEGNFYLAAKAIDNAAVHIACSANENQLVDPVGHSNILYDLFKLRDAIDLVSEFKEERR